jgi:uncharacterized protein DUF4276
MHLLPIVEGPGDRSAVPVLLRGLLEEHHRFDVTILPPYRYGEVRKVSKNVSRYALAAAKENVPILWILDCDDGCPVEWVHHLEEQLPAGLAVPLKFAFMMREYEHLFLAQRACLEVLGVDPDAALPPEPENIRGAKETISRLMPAGTAYKETVHQARLTAHLDFAIARGKSRSFRHLEKALLELIGPAPD